MWALISGEAAPLFLALTVYGGSCLLVGALLGYLLAPGFRHRGRHR